jgi:hypothetical protein
VRVVRSAKDKAWDEMKEKVGKIANALKINDWTIVEGEFDELSKRIEAKKVNIEDSQLCLFRVSVSGDWPTNTTHLQQHPDRRCWRWAGRARRAST